MKKVKIWLPLIIAGSVIAGIYIGSYYSNLKTVKGQSLSLARNGSKIDNLINLINREYVDTINANRLVEGVMPKLMGELDPHSVYIPASDLESKNEELEGSFGGIGVQFNMASDTISVISVISGGPAEKVGILPGDRIVTINDTAYVGKTTSTEQIMKRLRGAKGSTVRVGVKRSTAAELLPFEITRGDIPLTSIDAAFMVNDSTGYIKISKFGRTTYDEMMNALAKLKNDGAIGYIIDLRSNGGGFLDVAIKMINEFLPKDQLIVYTEGKAFPRNEVHSNGTGSFQQCPLVVLTDEFSASASEIFAGAIQDNDRGTVVGRRSYGKGLVQQQIPFSDGSAVRLTIARYYTPSGRSIQKEYKMGQTEDYDQDFVNRFLHGELYSKDSIKLNDSLRFETVNGRTVYGGGGIMPDIFVPRDTTGNSSYLNAVINSGIIYQYVFNYSDHNREKLSQYKDSQSLLEYLKSQPLLDDFVNFAYSKGIKRQPLLINLSKNIIMNQMYAYIARNILGEDAFFEIFLSKDNTMQKAIEIIVTGESFPHSPVAEGEE